MPNIIEFAQRIRDAADTPQAPDFCIEAANILTELSAQFTSLTKLAESALNVECFIDENGRTWQRPTAEEYAFAVRTGETWRNLALIQGGKLDNIRVALDEFKHTQFRLPPPKQ